MATLIRIDGSILEVSPNGETFTVSELHKLLECDCVEILRLADPYLMVIDESGALKEDRKLNMFASELYGQPIFGLALIAEYLTEIN